MDELIDEVIANGASSDAWFSRLDRERAMLAAELDRAEETDPPRGLALAAALWPYWVARGMLDEGRGRLTRLLALVPAASDPTRAKALCGAGMLAFLQGDENAARALQTESLRIARLLQEPALEADALLGLARVGVLARNPVEMERHARSSLAAAIAAGDDGRAATALHHVAEALRRQRKYGEALLLYTDAISRHRALEDRRSVALELHNLGRVMLLTGDPDTAREHLRDSLSTAGEIGHERLVGYCLLDLAEIEAASGAFALAARLIGASDARFAAVGATRDPEYVDSRERTYRLAQAALGEETLRAELASASSSTLESAAALGLEM